MTGIGVISNAKSTRNEVSMRAVHDVLAEHPEIPHLVFHEIAGLRSGLRDLAARGISHLVISGGDGTVQASINDLLQDRPFAELPWISLIAGGMTNVIARDVGMTGKPAVALRRLIERVKNGDPGELQERHVMGLSLDGGQNTTYGFVGGAIGFYQGTMLSRQHAHRIGLRQMLAANATILQSMVRLLIHGPGPRSGFTGEKVLLGLNGETPRQRDVFVLVLTTLDQLTPGIMPFWGERKRAIKYTLVDHPPKRFLRAVWPALRGRGLPWMEAAGYQSGSLDHLRMTLRSPFVMDGELFMPRNGNTIDITAGPAIPFHRF
ncbi:MAG TPA: diacylglycerol kinase family protein [Dongiaceae bacterium]